MDGVLVLGIRYTTVSDLIDSHSATWKPEILFDIFDETQARKICSIPLSKAGLSDVVNWRPDGSGVYSVKSGYRLLCNGISSSPSITPPSLDSLLSRFYNEMWAVKIPSKIRITMWRIFNNFLPTYANLQSRRLNVVNACPFCLISSETVEHIMRDCCFVRELLVRQYVHFPFPSAEIEWKEWLALTFCNFIDQQKSIMMVTFWAVWYSRNKLVHEGISPSVSQSLSFIKAFIRESGSPNPLTNIGAGACRSRWSAPELNVVKCNFDSAFDVQHNESTSGIICRNSDGLIMASGTVPHWYVVDAFMAEAFACLQAVIFANELGFRRVVFEWDSLTVIRRVSASTPDNSVISTVIHDIREAVKELESVAFNFVHREVNSAAHALAREGRGHMHPRYWIEEAPLGATSAAAVDRKKLNAN
ncbi:hypothetical protein V6N11_082669 [Hibiscus sabdariffa]|uniref:Uncharacterized protein n=1 Tax=Hibiscus sabdariffa TaxID=183260 RepID=A0ABR2P9T2_9ROSI